MNGAGAALRHIGCTFGNLDFYDLTTARRIGGWLGDGRPLATGRKAWQWGWRDLDSFKSDWGGSRDGTEKSVRVRDKGHPGNSLPGLLGGAASTPGVREEPVEPIDAELRLWQWRA